MNVVLDTCLRYAVMFAGAGIGAALLRFAAGDPNSGKSDNELNGRFSICVGLFFVGLALLPTIGPYLAACIPDGIREWMGPRTGWRTVAPWQQRFIRTLFAIVGPMMIWIGIRTWREEQTEP